MHGYWIGGLIGAAVAALALVVVFRTRFIRVAESPYDLDTTIRTLVEVLEEADGWHTPGVRDLNELMRRHGLTFSPRIRVVEMCKASNSALILRDDRRLAALMPCAIAVYEDDDGHVWVSRMNTRLVGRLIGGPGGRVLRHEMASAQAEVLSRLRQRD